MELILVDDEKELVSTLAERLSLRGINADWMTSGEEALVKMEGTPYDLAVLDMKMPKMSGLELRAKMQEIQPQMKYIFMSGHGSVEDYNAASEKDGADCYLVKPVNIDLLIKKITDILGK